MSVTFIDCPIPLFPFLCFVRVLFIIECGVEVSITVELSVTIGALIFGVYLIVMSSWLIDPFLLSIYNILCLL